MKSLLQIIVDDQHEHWWATEGHKFTVGKEPTEKQWELIEVIQQTDSILLTLSGDGNTFRTFSITYKEVKR